MAVNVTDSPYVEGLAEEDTEVAEFALLTVTPKLPDEAGLFPESPP
jgi:hypothetical protein